MLNQCQFIGHLGRDPDVRTMNNGDKVANLSIGVTEKWNNKNTGERQERTEWVRASIFGNLAGIAEQYLSKGSKIYIAGKMQTRSWEDQSGQTKYSTEIVLNGFDGKLVMLDSRQSEEYPPAGSPPADNTQEGGDDLDDDPLPF